MLRKVWLIDRKDVRTMIHLDYHSPGKGNQTLLFVYLTMTPLARLHDQNDQLRAAFIG